MELIVKVTSEDPRAPLADILRLPLGLDVWEAKPDHLVLRAAEASLDRLGRMGYRVEPLQALEAHLRAFATAEATQGYHSAASLEEDLRALAQARPELAELKEVGRSVEGRPILALRLGDRRVHHQIVAGTRVDGDGEAAQQQAASRLDARVHEVEATHRIGDVRRGEAAKRVDERRVKPRRRCQDAKSDSSGSRHGGILPYRMEQ